MAYKTPEPDDSWFARLQQQAQDYDLACEQFQEWLWEQPVQRVADLLQRAQLELKYDERREIDSLLLGVNSLMEQAATLILQARIPGIGESR